MNLPNSHNFSGQVLCLDTSVMQQEVRIGSVKHPACSKINFPAKESAYYFMSADCSGGVTSQYNIASNVKYLNFTDYETSWLCSATEDQPCKVTINNNCFGSWKNICLLAYAIPSSPYTVDPPTTHIQVKTLKRYQLQVLIFPAALIVIGTLGFLHCKKGFVNFDICISHQNCNC